MNILKKNSDQMVEKQDESTAIVENTQQTGTNQFQFEEKGMLQELKSGRGFFEGSGLSFEENMVQLYSYYLANMTDQKEQKEDNEGIYDFYIA